MNRDAPGEPAPFHIVLLATGGTIEKHYDTAAGALALGEPVIESLLDTLVLADVRIDVERLMAVDSLDMTAAERQRIVATVDARLGQAQADAIVITHGTDTLADTARALVDVLGVPARPVILTGAMRPWRTSCSDAAQNVAQAVIACRLLPPGVHAVMHGRVVAGEHVEKDYARLTLTDGPRRR